MPALFSRVKTWGTTDTLTAADLNAEFDNILTFLVPLFLDDYSVNVAQMQVQTDPGEVGTESLATSLGAELARIRYAINEIKGTTYWYTTAGTSLAELTSALGTSLLSNRIVSGRKSTLSSQSLFLVPAGSGRTVTVKGLTTNFSYVIAGTTYTISTDVTSGTLTAAATSNNTCLINEATLTGQPFTKQLGEFDTTITVDAMGSAITALTGSLCGFKVVHSAVTEYFIAKVESTTTLTKAYRGYFFDSTDAGVPRVALSDNDVITLLKLTWVFAKTDGTLAVTYTNPRTGPVAPSSPSVGDYWYDTVNLIWKTYDSSSFVAANALLIGVAVSDGTNTLGARSFDQFKTSDYTNTIELDRTSNTEARSKLRSGTVSVFGSTVKFTEDFIRWDITTDLASGVTEAASTTYYLYLNETGQSYIDNKAPFDRNYDRRGYYHPFETWRCIGEVYNNASSNYSGVLDYLTYNASRRAYSLTPTVAASALTIAVTNTNGDPITPTLPVRLDFPDVANGKTAIRMLQRPLSITVPSSASLGMNAAVAAYTWVYFMDDAGAIDLGVKNYPILDIGATQASTLISAGATSQTVLYSGVTHGGSVAVLQAGRLTSTQASAGTWATAPSAVSLDAVPVRSSIPPTAYTPAFGAGFGTVSQSSYFYMRNGSFLEVYGYHNTGTVAGSLATVAIPVISPTITIDAGRSPLNNNSSSASPMVGIFIGNGGVDSRAAALTATATSTTLIYFGGPWNASSTVQLQPANGNVITYTGVTVSINFRVPILGWTDYGP